MLKIIASMSVLEWNNRKIKGNLLNVKENEGKYDH